MSIAEIRGKISDTGSNLSERMEDLLTSDVFGCLRYLPPEVALLPYLNTARSVEGNAFQLDGRLLRLHSAFWPHLTLPDTNPCEPDVVIGLETENYLLHLVMIEAKYYSGLSSEEDEQPAPRNQLARELDNLNRVTPRALGWEPNLQVASRTLLYVTQDTGIPRKDMAAALDEYSRKRGVGSDIYWATWRLLPPILEIALLTESDPGHRAVLEDMLALLLRKGLTMFRGIQPITHRFNLSDFYHVEERKYRWPRFLVSHSSLPQYVYKVAEHD